MVLLGVFEVSKLADFEAEISSWTIKFDSVRDWKAERTRLPLMRGHYETMLTDTGLPPNLQAFADSFWQVCLTANVNQELEAGVKARAKRSLPSFVRETHLNLLLHDVFQEVATVDNSVETDTQKKTDFLIESCNHPVVVRLHTYTNTRRAHKFAAMQKKTPLAEEGSGKFISDYRLTIDRKTGRTLPNDFWVYSATQVQEVVDYFQECEDSYTCELTA